VKDLVKKSVLAGMTAAFVALPVMAQSVDTAKLDDILKQLQQLKEQNERLEAEVEYLKSNALEARKSAASEAVTVETLNTTAAVAAGKYTWSGDFRYRHENIDAEENVTPRNRERVRVRFGVLAKVNDRINAKLQLSSTNSGNDNYRSTNQTLGTGWDRKPVSFDQAYVDWKASNTANLVLGKMPIPFATTVSYFWDKDLTPEGASLKYARGPLFGSVSYFSVNERDSGTSSLASKDADMVAAQVGIRMVTGRVTWTGALGYFDVNGVQDRVVAATTGCTIDGAFGSGQGTGNNAFGNTTYTGGALNTTGSSTSCVRLLNDYNLSEALLQADFTAGKFPISVFVDYMKNDGIVTSQTDKQDTALSAGFLFNKAGAAKTWEFGYVYQKGEKDSDWTGFHDSDFGGGLTDSNGGVFKLAYVPATNWTLNAQYFMNERFIDNSDTAPTKDYKRLQLDLNYKY
jgi:outer membrane murein-binding lipoprotein Lpp